MTEVAFKARWLNPRPGYYVYAASLRETCLTESFEEAQAFQPKSNYPLIRLEVTILDESHDGGRTIARRTWRP